jgi:hypothetical protein
VDLYHLCDFSLDMAIDYRVKGRNEVLGKNKAEKLVRKLLKNGARSPSCEERPKIRTKTKELQS